MRDQYHDDLDAITQSLVEITRLAGSAINKATQALLDADLQAAESVISGDAAIDQIYADIEARALDLLARQQPVASDLRTIITSLRMVADIERMGDLALHIAKVARRRYPASAIPPQLHATVLEMGQVAQRICAKCSSVIAGRDVSATASKTCWIGASCAFETIVAVSMVIAMARCGVSAVARSSASSTAVSLPFSPLNAASIATGSLA